MTLDNIIQVARDAGFSIKVEDVSKFERFAALVAAAEREACLDLVNRGTGEATSADVLKILHMERDRISAAIRARSET